DGTMIELGSGEFFGELALLGEQHITLDVHSLGYSKLLMLSLRDFEALLAKDANLRERVQVVARQRLRAIEVWKQFSQTGTTTPSTTPVPQVTAPLPEGKPAAAAAPSTPLASSSSATSSSTASSAPSSSATSSSAPSDSTTSSSTASSASPGSAASSSASSSSPPSPPAVQEG